MTYLKYVLRTYFNTRVKGLGPCAGRGRGALVGLGEAQRDVLFSRYANPTSFSRVG
jgi:hypothetical protein